MKVYKVFFHNFWPGFMTDEQNNISFYKEIFNTDTTSLEIKDKAEDADIIIGASNNNLHMKDKKYILYLGEPHNTYDLSGVDIILGGIPEFKDKRAVFIPTFLSYLISNSFYNRVIEKPIRKTIPPHFCCMLIGNVNVPERVGIFHELQKYKKVVSAGIGLNNTGWIMTIPFGRPGYFEFISQFKFVIVTENTKIDAFITEKLFHGYLSGTVPIYWGSDYVSELFNTDSMVLLKDYNAYNIDKMLQEVIYLDNNDDAWLNKVNQQVFKEKELFEYFKIDSVRKRFLNKIDEPL
jgi:hypothetical protein